MFEVTINILHKERNKLNDEKFSIILQFSY